nr:hypothetical protein [Tanacetum cinerariifolium]
SGGDVLDLIGDVDPTDEDGDIGMGDSTGVSASLDGEIFSGGKKCQESNIGDSDNTGDRYKIVAVIGDVVARRTSMARKRKVVIVKVLTLFSITMAMLMTPIRLHGHHRSDIGWGTNVPVERRDRMQGGRLWRVLEAAAKNEPQGGDVYFLEGQGDDVGAW